MNDLDFLDNMIKQLKYVKAQYVSRDRLIIKARDCNGTIKAKQKASVNLNWQCMEVDKAVTDFARSFKGSILDVETGNRGKTV